MAGPDVPRRFLSRQDGNVAVLFALCLVPMLALTGAAIDYGFATRLQTKLQSADDATALALCQTPNNTLAAALQKQAETAMGGYMQDASLKVDTLQIIPSSPGVARQITLTSHISSGTYLSGFTSVVSPSVAASSQCATPVPKTFEIALVLDNTGSMANASNGQSKLQALQTAATYFIEYVYKNPAFSDQTKVSIVPFAGAVTVKDPRLPLDYTSDNTNWIDWTGQSSYHWKNINKTLATTGNALNLSSRSAIFHQLASLNPATYSTSPYAYYDWDWGGCIETPPYPQNVLDTKPDVNNPDSLYQQYFAPDEPGPGTSDQGGLYGYNYVDSKNNISNHVWNDYLPDTSCQNQSSTEYRSAESRGCKYASATAANVAPRKTTMIGAIDIGQNGPNWGCTSAPIQRLLTLRSGSNKATLESLINNMSPRGSTNIHEGFMWGWRTISPNGVFAADTAKYSTANTLPTAATNKVIILMTDGMNDWLNLLGNSATTGNGGLYNALGYPTNSNTGSPGDGAGTSANARLQSNPNHQTPVIENGYSNIWDPSSSSGRSAIDGLFSEACANAKASPNVGDPPKVSIYTIAFSIQGDAIDQAGQTLLKNCASSSAQYFLANDSNGLIAAFAKIANSIGALRISQ